MRRPKRVCRPCEDIGFLARGAGGGEEKRRCKAESGATGHEVSILIRLGGGGRGPSNVSMMIIRPPQHGHRRAGKGVSVSLSASAPARSDKILGAASAWRARSMFRDGICRIGQPHAGELDVAGDRVRRDRNRLDPLLRMLPRVPAEEGQPGSERHLANAETDNAVRNISGKLVLSAALNRRRTDGARHVQLQW